MARNSAKRMQVTNVARPDTATDPTDVKSKIAKQGEIKTKIIDEEQLDELGPDTLSSYKSKAADSEKQLTDKSSSLKVPAQDRNDAAVKANQRRQGMQLATKKLGEETIDEAEKDPDKHFAAQSKKMQDAINLHLRKGKSYWEAHRAAKVHVKEEVEIEEGYSFKKTESGKWEGTGFGSTPAYHELHTDGKATGITVGGTKGGSYFVKKDGKHVTSSSSMDFAKKAAIDHHKGVKEEVEIEEAAPKWDEKEFKLTRPGTWKHSSGSSIHYGNGSKSYRVMHGNDSDPKKYSTLDGAQKAIRAKHVKEEVSDAAKKVLGDVAKQHGGKVPFKSTSYKDGKRVVTHGYNDEKGNRVVTKTTNEEVEQVDEVSSALLYRAKQAAQKKAGWLMPGDKGKGDKAWNRVKKFRDAGVKKQDQERKQALTKEELALSVAEAYGKGYKSPWDKIEKAKPGIGKRIDAHADDLKKSTADYQAVVDKDKKKDVKEGAVPDSWEDNSPQKRKATAKKVAADSMDHDKTAKIVEAAKADDAKPGDMDDTDPKKIKGGKTEVDLNPKTDDRTEDETTQDKAGKSAAAKANKEIGQKSKPVKEEAMSEKNFGLPESLIDIVTETLKGGQKKLDKNHNGKIDGQDFKILRGDTKVKAKPQYDKARPAFKEEVEEVELSADELARIEEIAKKL
jgi:hypothetical protein